MRLHTLLMQGAKEWAQAAEQRRPRVPQQMLGIHYSSRKRAKGVAGAAAVQAVRRGLVSLQQQEEGQGGGGSSSSAGSERGLVLGPVS
jgi:hypothetical protein